MKAMKKDNLKKEIEKYVEDWMNGHEADTFIKNEYGVYMYSAGPVSLNIKVFFESLLEDFIEDKVEDINQVVIFNLPDNGRD